MSSITATRTTRFAPPAEPTRKAASRRTLAGQGSSVVGRAERPVLRIVADDERAPVFTRVARRAGRASGRAAWSSLSRPRCAGSASTTSSPPSTTATTQRLEVAPPRRSTVRLTRRGRLVVLGLGLAAALGLGLYAASVSDRQRPPRADPHGHRAARPDPVGHLVPRGRRDGSGDVRSMMSHLEAINHLDSAALQVGQHLRVPQYAVDSRDP